MLSANELKTKLTQKSLKQSTQNLSMKQTFFMSRVDDLISKKLRYYGKGSWGGGGGGEGIGERILNLNGIQKNYGWGLSQVIKQIKKYLFSSCNLKSHFEHLTFLFKDNMELAKGKYLPVILKLLFTFKMWKNKFFIRISI